MTNFYSYQAESQFGTIETGKYSTFFDALPKPALDRAPVVMTHGSGAQWGFVDAARPGSIMNGPMLGYGGINSVSSELAGQAWGNDAAMTAVDSCFTKIKARHGLTGSKFHLFGGSMGGFTALRYATLHPEKVASMTLLFPLCNLTNFWNANAAAVRNEISAAWGVANGTPPPAGASIAAGLAAISGQVPVDIYYSSADAIVSVPDIIATAAVLNAGLHDVGPNGHSEQTVLDYINFTGGAMQTTIAFMKKYGA